MHIEVGLAFGGAPIAHRVSRDALAELLEQSDARTLRQFLITTFNGIGPDSADKILEEAGTKIRVAPGNLKPAEIDKLHKALQSVNLTDGQSMNILRYANRVPLAVPGRGVRNYANRDPNQLALVRADTSRAARCLPDRSR